MGCPAHRGGAVRTCTRCIDIVAKLVSKQVLLIGPRSEQQFSDIVARTSLAVPWAMQMPREVYTDLANVEDRVLHVVHAFAERVAADLTAMTPLDIALRGRGGSSIASMVRTNLADVHVRALIDVSLIKKTICVRAKSVLGAYDATTLTDAIKRAGPHGVSRCTVAGEYGGAHADIERIIRTNVVYGTPDRVWHCSVARPARAGLWRAAIAAGIL